MKTFQHWKSFFIFLKSPDYHTPALSLKEKLLLVFNTFILKILFSLFIFFLIFIVFRYKAPAALTDNQSTTTLLLAALIAGVFEELVFRLSFTKFNLAYFSFSISGILFIFIKKIYFHTMIFSTEGLLPAFLIAVACAPILYFAAKNNEERLSIFWEKHFPYVFYLSTLIFAAIHFFNAQVLDIANLKLNLTHLSTALFLGFIRIRAGLIAAIIIHVIWDMML